MKTIILLAVTLIANFSSIAQQPDYLVKNNGDTVYGNILLLKKTLLITSNDKTEQIDYRDVKFVRAEKKRETYFMESLCITMTIFTKTAMFTKG